MIEKEFSISYSRFFIALSSYDYICILTTTGSEE